MMLITKKGLKLWGSGMLVVLIVAVFGITMPYLGFAEASLAVRALWFLVIFPMAIGASQRWFWDELRRDGTEL